MAMSVSMDDAAGGDEGEGAETIVAEINITPLTDVFLVLLIIFMVTTTAAVDAEKASREGVKVALPKADAAGPITNKRAVPILTITKDGKLFVFTNEVAPANLEEALRKAIADSGQDAVLIRGDTSVNLGSAVNVMSSAKRAGAKSINILTQSAN
ncbi:MAG TPA: biopolymer transporter ExbD [Polyangia bacterium]